MGQHDYPEMNFHLTDRELDQISTEGRLLIGDGNATTDVDIIHVIGVTFNTAETYIKLVAHHESVIILLPPLNINW